LQLSSKQREFFNVNGYLIIDNYFNKKELDDFKESFRHLIQISLKKIAKFHPEVKPDDFIDKEFGNGIMKLEEIDHAFVANIYDTIYQVPEFLRIVAKPETTQCINQLLNRRDDNPLYTFTCRCRIDPPDDERRTTKWHQEVFYSIPKSEFLQTWAPLISDATLENGSIEFCVGSHKDGIAQASFLNVKGSANPFSVDDDLVQKYEKKQITMKLGQFMIFNSKLIHRSGKNRSNNVRYSLVGMYHTTDNENFMPPLLNFEFKNISPKQYFDEIFSSVPR